MDVAHGFKAEDNAGLNGNQWAVQEVFVKSVWTAAPSQRTAEPFDKSVHTALWRCMAHERTAKFSSVCLL
jgi:hypothetical protein